MLSKEKIEKAKDRCNSIIEFCENNKECKENNFCSDCYIEIEDIKAIETLLQYIEELEEIKGMKESIELAEMDIKSLLKFKYENERLKKIIDEMAKEINKTTSEKYKIKHICEKRIKEQTITGIKQYFEKKVEEK